MTKRKDGRWQEKVKVGDRIVYCYGKTKAEVNKKVLEALEKHKAGLMFPAIAEAWIGRHEREIAPNTMRGYKPAVKRAQDYFEGADIAEIRPVDVQRFLDHEIREHEMADKTARTQLLVVNLICRYAVGEGYMDVNPCADIRVPRGLAKTEREPPSSHDLAQIKLHVDDTPFGLFPYLLLCTGLRRGEALALQWKDFDMKERVIHVTKSVYHVANHPKIKEPKTRCGKRDVPIIDALLPHLKPGKPNEYIWGSLLDEDSFLRLWYRYRKDTGVTCTPHQLRHAYATMLWESGVDIAMAQLLLGHAQVSTTMDIYTHIRDEKQAEKRHMIMNMELIS